MKPLTFLSLPLAIALFAVESRAEPQNGLFGFSRNRDQISNALFPGGTATGTGPAPAAASKPEMERDSETIFRGGKPKKIESASYLIRDGEKIEKPVEDSDDKPSFFRKLKKSDSEASPLLAATRADGEPSEKKKPGRLFAPLAGMKKEQPDSTPDAAPPADEDRIASSPVSEPVATSPVATSPVATSPVATSPVATTMQDSDESDEPAHTASPVAATPVEPRETKKRSGGFFSFFSRDKKKDSDVSRPVVTPVPEAAPTASTPEEEASPAESSMSREEGGIPDAPTFAGRAEPSAPTPAETTDPAPEPEPKPKPAAPDNGETAEVPTFVGTPQKPARDKKDKKKGLSLPNPIEALKPEPKPVSLVGAETIIEDGEIVGEEDDIVESNIVEMSDGEKKPPQVIDGVTTYGSWDDVEARNPSSADKILNELRRR